MANKTVTAMNNEVRTSFFNGLMENVATNCNMEVIQTDVTAFDVPLEREDGETVYATVKVTVHKDDYNIEDKVAEFADVLAQREKRQAELAAKKAASLAKQAERAAAKAAKEKKAE